MKFVAILYVSAVSSQCARVVRVVFFWGGMISSGFGVVLDGILGWGVDDM